LERNHSHAEERRKAKIEKLKSKLSEHNKRVEEKRD
jgi:hypothetical protein